MNRVSKRSAFALVLAFALLAGLVLFCVRYVVDAGQWVTYPGSPHLYTGSNLNTGVVFDRAGQTLLAGQNPQGFGRLALVPARARHPGVLFHLALAWLHSAGIFQNQRVQHRILFRPGQF